MKNKYNNWHKTFFTGLWLEVQKSMFSEKSSLMQTKFIINALKLRRKQKVLDIPCGNGRISNILSRKGIDVTGVDFNEQLLNEAKKEAVRRRFKSRFFNMNMYDITWENEFDAAICYWGSFGYFSDELNIRFLENVYSSLKKRGRLLIDTHVAESILPKFQEHGWIKVGDIYVLEDRVYSVADSRINVEWTFIKKGKMETRQSSIRVYTYAELIQILKSIGFKKFTAYGSIKGDLFKFRPARLYLVSQK